MPVKKRKEIRVREEEIPDVPRFGQFMTPDSSVAEAITKMTSDEEQAIAVLSNLDENDVTRLSALTTIYVDFNIKWLKTMVLSEETLRAAIKGLRSNQLTEIARAPPIVGDSGTLDRIKGRLFHR
jgi:2-oxo-4-hydroxy-4-carboxy--5-ureidoimidazoline (OHCU) decarboxylase